jgi:hypothetical protein
MLQLYKQGQRFSSLFVRRVYPACLSGGLFRLGFLAQTIEFTWLTSLRTVTFRRELAGSRALSDPVTDD